MQSHSVLTKNVDPSRLASWTQALASFLDTFPRHTPVPYALTYLAKGPPTLSVAPDMDELILEKRYFMRTVDLIVVLQQQDDASVISLFSGR